MTPKRRSDPPRLPSPRAFLPPRGSGTPWVVLAASLLLTAAATSFVAEGTAARDRARFENAVQATQDRITGRLNVYLTTLRGAAGLMAAEDARPSEAEFRAYVERLDVQRYYPGIQGIGWSERVARDPAADRGETHAIRYLEPLDRRNQAALGFDMYAEETRRTAMARARDRGEPALTGRVRLVQEIFGPEQAGFLLYVPVYRGGLVPPTLEGRREGLAGFVYSPFRADDLFAGIFGTEQEPRVSFRVYDGPRADTASLLYASQATPGHEPRYRAARALVFAGRRWTVTYASQPRFEEASGGFLVPVTLGAGLLVSALLFGLTSSQARARAAAEKANRAKSDFLATMSHELRTPLNAIGGYVELLAMGIRGPVNERQRTDLERVRRAQQHLLGLINDVLNFAKLEAGRTEFRADALPVLSLVDDVEPLIGPQAQARGVRFARADGDPRACLRGDREKVLQVLLNLLSNAVKFTGSGGEVSVGWEERGNHVFVHVSDTGVGISPDRLGNIFDPFVQVDADLTRKHEGTGLGLAISRELARGMGGDLRAESEPGAGSTFTLCLPSADGADPPG